MAEKTKLEGATGVYLIMGQWRYGAGVTLNEAKKNFTNQGAGLTKGLTVVKFDDETEYHGVDQMGLFHFKGNSPEQIEVPPGKRIPAGL